MTSGGLHKPLRVRIQQVEHRNEYADKIHDLRAAAGIN